MADFGSTRALIAAFTFGIVVSIASATLFLRLRDYGSSFLRDGTRLALVAFLMTSGLWAQTTFFAILNDSSTTGCQVAVIFASFFDQFARFSVLQSLLWMVNQIRKSPRVEKVIYQGILCSRFIVGSIFIGFQRPQVDYACVSWNSAMSIGIILVVIDTLLVIGLAVKVFTGSRKEMSDDGARGRRTRTILPAIGGFGVWTGSSAPMLLGEKSVDFIVRTAVPAVGLTILICILGLFGGRIDSVKAKPLGIALENSPATSTPAAGERRHREIVIPNFSHHPSQHEQSRERIKTPNAPDVPNISREQGDALPIIERPEAGQATVGMGGVHVQGRLFPPAKPQTEQKPMRFSSEAPTPHISIVRKDGRLMISRPVLQSNYHEVPIRHVAVPDLVDSTKKDLERDGLNSLSSRFSTNQVHGALDDTMKTPKYRSTTKSLASRETVLEPASSTLKPISTATTSSSQLSPGMEEIRRRSPRSAPQLPQQDPSSNTLPFEVSEPRAAPCPPPKDPRVSTLPRSRSVRFDIRPSRQAPLSREPELPSKNHDVSMQGRASSGLPSNPRAYAASVAIRGEKREKEDGVLLDRGLDRPDSDVSETMGENIIRNLARFPVPPLNRAVPIVHRPRPIPRKVKIDPAFFPVEDLHNLHQHQRSVSHTSLLGHTAVADLPVEDQGQSQDHHESVFRLSGKRKSSPVLPAHEFSALPMIRHATITDSNEVASASQDNEKGQEDMVIMLDVPQNPKLGPVPGSQQIDASRPYWHHYVGEPCLSFSERRQMSRRRKVPPPAPLLLHQANRISMSTPGETSPSESLRASNPIQSQPQKLEGPNRESINGEQHQRSSLLALLEMEIGQQETQWKQMRHTWVWRDSHSTLDASPNFDLQDDKGGKASVPQLGESSVETISVESEPSLQHRPTGSHTTDNGIPRWSYARSYECKTTLRQDPVTEGEDINLVLPDHAAHVLSSATASASSVQLGRHATPDANNSEIYDKFGAMSQTPPRSEVGATGLWCPAASKTQVAGATREFLWTFPGESQVEHQNMNVEPFDDPGRSIKRKGRRDLEPLEIESSQLWKKPIAERHLSAGLWRGASRAGASPGNCKTEEMVLTGRRRSRPRPVTQRPPRRIKRVSLLPDILESPKYLPGKQGRLGIFQFPGGGIGGAGGVSDNVTVHSTGSQMRQQATSPGTGTMTSGGARIDNLDSKAAASVPGLGLPVTDNQSLGLGPLVGNSEEGSQAEKFADDDTGTSDRYRENDCDSEEEDDDEFDDTTIWEIASLLQYSSFVPSCVSIRDIESTGVSADIADEPHIDQQKLGNVSGHGDGDGVREPRPIFPNAAADDELSDRASHSDYQDCSCANPSLLEITNGFPSPPPRSASAWTNESGSHANAQVTATEVCQGNLSQACETCQGPQHTGTCSESGPGTLMHQDANMRRTYLSLAAAGDASRAPMQKAELPIVEEHAVGVRGSVTCVTAKAKVVDSVSNHHSTWAPIDKASPPAPQPAPGVLFGLYQRQAVEANLLWTRRPVKTPPARFTKGLAQPDDQVWRSYLSQTSTLDIVRIQNHRAANLSTITSSSLWSPQQATHDSPKQHSLLWNPINTTQQQSTFADSMALWSPTAPLHVSPKGFAQPDNATWNTYLSTIVDAVRVLPRKSEPATIESNSLWTPAPKKVKVEDESRSHNGLWGSKQSKEQKEAAPTPSMWVQPPTVEKVSYGLSQPEEHVWATYLLATEDVLRVKPRTATPASIQSSNLWSPPPKMRLAESNEPLWSAPKFIPVDMDSSTDLPLPEAVSAAGNFGLWTPPAVIEYDENPEGLFSLNHKRSDYRSTSLEPAALNMERRPRAALEPYADFVFAHLWNEAPLWRGPPVVVEEQAEGLFSLDHRRTIFRTTTEPPAGLDMIRKPRISDEPLPKLTSNRLWSVPSKPSTAVEIDWLALSTVGPKKAPSIASIASDNESLTTEASIETDASSVKSFVLEKHLSQVATTAPAKTALWSQRTKSTATSPTTPSRSEAISMWQASTPRFVETESEYTIAEPDEERSNTFRYRRKSDDKTSPTNMSPSNFLRLSSFDETPRDFSAQSLWTQSNEEVLVDDEQNWLDESVMRISRYLPLA